MDETVAERNLSSFTLWLSDFVTATRKLTNATASPGDEKTETDRIWAEEQHGEFPLHQRNRMESRDRLIELRDVSVSFLPL